MTVALDPDMYAAGQYSCTSQTGVTYTGPEGCTTAPDSDPCDSGQASYCGNRRSMKNWVMRIPVAANGSIIAGDPARIITTDETTILGFPPAPALDNSWDAGLITFTADCTNCSVARDDNYRMLRGTSLSMDIGANDDLGTLLDNTATTAAVTMAPTDGTCTIAPATPGDVKAITCNYTSNGPTPSTDTFEYTVTDGILDPSFGLTATVTVVIEENIPPVANDFTMTLDTQGVSPSSVSGTRDVTSATPPDGVLPDNSGGNDPAVTVTTAPLKGAVAQSGNANQFVQYTPNADFFQGDDTFVYEIIDSNFGVIAPQDDNGIATVTITNVTPAAPTAETDLGTIEQAGEPVAFTITGIAFGNGSPDEHDVAWTCSSANEIADTSLTTTDRRGAAIRRQIQTGITRKHHLTGQDSIGAVSPGLRY